MNAGACQRSWGGEAGSSADLVRYQRHFVIRCPNLAPRCAENTSHPRQATQCCKRKSAETTSLPCLNDLELPPNRGFDGCILRAENFVRFATGPRSPSDLHTLIVAHGELRSTRMARSSRHNLWFRRSLPLALLHLVRLHCGPPSTASRCALVAKAVLCDGSLRHECCHPPKGRPSEGSREPSDAPASAFKF
jgi:hypothetical protein